MANERLDASAEVSALWAAGGDDARHRIARSISLRKDPARLILVKRLIHISFDMNRFADPNSRGKLASRGEIIRHQETAIELGNRSAPRIAKAIQVPEMLVRVDDFNRLLAHRAAPAVVTGKHS